MARKWKESHRTLGGASDTAVRAIVVHKARKRKVKVAIRRSSSRTSQDNQIQKSTNPVQTPLPANQIEKEIAPVAEAFPEPMEHPSHEEVMNMGFPLDNMNDDVAIEERQAPSPELRESPSSVSPQPPNRRTASRYNQPRVISTRRYDIIEDKLRPAKPLSPTKIPRHVPEPQPELKIREIVSDILYPGISWDLHSLSHASNILAPLFQNFNPHLFIPHGHRPVNLPDHVYEKYDLRRPNLARPPSTHRLSRVPMEMTHSPEHSYRTFKNDFSNRTNALTQSVAPPSHYSQPPLQYQAGPVSQSSLGSPSNNVFQSELSKSPVLTPFPPHITLLRKQYSEPTIRDLEQERISNDEERGSSGRQLSSSASSRYNIRRSCDSVLSKAGSLLRNASSGGGRMTMEVKLGGLGPDKDNDAYKTRVRSNLKV